MKIFLTGATGYVGSYVTELLLNEGNTVHALCRNPENLSIIHPNLVAFKGDINDEDSIEKAMEGCEQVYHLAAFAKPWAKDPTTYYKMNVEAVKTILDVALRQKINKIVFTSTAGVLGPSYSKPVSESDKRIGKEFNEYEESKTQAEEICRKYVLEKRLNIVIVNPPRIYGPGADNESNSITKILKMFDEGKWKTIPGNGKSIGNYVHVEDVAKGHLLAMKHGKAGERYILGGENLTYSDFFETMKRVTGQNHELFHIPVWVMMLAGNLMLIREKLTGKPPLITPKWIKKYSYNWDLDTSKAQKELGYTFRKFEEGLMQTYETINKK